MWQSQEFRAACLGLFALTLFRLWYCTRLELVGDEAYYWVQSRHLDMCYFDKGPAVAWTIAAGRGLFGDTVFGIRFFAVLLSAGTGVWLFILARQLFSDRVALATLVLAAVVPIIAVGSILMTIDPLSIFFWTVAACAFWKAKDSTGGRWWVLTGFLVGLGVLAKYTNAAQLLSFALFCAWCAPYRQHFRRPTLGLLALAALIVTLPVWIWNANHDWVTLRHLAQRGDLENGWRVHPLELLQFLGGQAGVISPLVFLGILVAAVSWAGTRPTSPEVRFLLCLFLPLFVGYAALSLNHAAQPNWTAPSYVAGLILLASRWPGWVAVRPRLRWLGAAALTVALVETIALHNTAWFHLPPGKDPLDRARGWRDLAAKVVEVQAREGTDFIIARTYQTASLLSFHLPGHPFVYLPSAEKARNQFSIWAGYRDRPVGSVALFVSERGQIPDALAKDFEQVASSGEIFPQADGRTLPPLHLFRCRNLRALHATRETAHDAPH